MIKEIIIENFKQFKKLKISNLSQITLLGGKNNCGKTSILESIFLFFDRGDPDVFIRQSIWRGIQSLTFTPKELCQPYFNDFNIKNPIKITTIESKNSKHIMTADYNNSYQHKISTRPVPIQEIQKQQEKNIAITNISEAIDFSYSHNSKNVGKTHLLIRFC